MAIAKNSQVPVHVDNGKPVQTVNVAPLHKGPGTARPQDAKPQPVPPRTGGTQK